MAETLLVTVYGLLSAFSWGSGDFCGGMATKKGSAFSVVLFSQIIGGLFLVILAFVFGEPLPAWPDALLGALAGLAGMMGLLALYHGLAGRQMGLMAPLTAVIAAVVPLPVAFLQDGLPNISTLIGFGVALTAVWFLSSTGGGTRLVWRDLGLPLIAGTGFGLFFVITDQITVGSIIWPLIAARLATTTFLLLFLLLRKEAIRPPRASWPLVALSGIFDTGGNAFFILAAQAGRLDIASLLSSLYPAVTVLLAWIIIKERLAVPQWVGVGLAMLALLLIVI